MYYIALIAPKDINQKVLKWKNFFKEQFNCLVALKSPAHITIIPPFWMKEDLESTLIDDIGQFSTNQNVFEIKLKDFQAFKSKTIYVNVVKSEELDALNNSFKDFIYTQNKYPIKRIDDVFQPHVTLATRDLHKRAFIEAWEIFSTKKYEATWLIDGISLLKHNKKNWDVVFTSQLED